MLRHEAYDQQCDVWSAGIILYVLLSGITPFYGRSPEETKKLILNAKPKFAGNVIYPLEPAWKRISPEAKDLINRSLEHSPKNRITASEALSHPWILKYSVDEPELHEDVFNSLKGLKSFRTQMTLQKAVLSYLASQELSNEEEEKIRNAFILIDKNKDGRISRSELKEAYKLLGKSEKTADLEAKKVIVKADLTKNGSIDYNEFLMMNLSRENALSEEKLKEAFKFFDSVILRYT